ncbi:hypothetical protein KJ652_04130 [Patescibacteria group bacterium]|nr:hypothetical protein [Patescibacteria group bacterium]MBU1123754.1 hypothetical protein [Patescibacteria group bacterium]MBU1910823.1 hypothetical protein [Patescibacteria group bacterium]
MKTIPASLIIDARITDEGIDIFVNDDSFPIRYPKEIWSQYPQNLREILRDNLAYSTTLYLPQMFGLPKAQMRTSRPIAETFLFKNGIYDMPICALTDNASSMEYVKNFFNTDWSFADNNIATPRSVDFSLQNAKPQRAIIPFSFGKESLLSFALSREIGMEPIPVLFIEPANIFEYEHKKELIERFQKEFDTTVHVVEFSPGIFRYGTFWGLKTELGWGLHTTEYALLTLPFAYALNAQYTFPGNEQSCNDIFNDREGVRTYKAGYDQHSDWLSQQTLLATLMLGRKIEVISLMEPLYELAITGILHRRYPEVGKYQMSCFADSEHGRLYRWCQRCTKCGYMYALCCGSGVSPQKAGFKDNLFSKEYEEIYEHFFGYDPKHPIYGSQDELGTAFMLSERAGYSGESMDRFRKEILPFMIKRQEQLLDKYLGINSEKNLPPTLSDPIMKIFAMETEALKEKARSSLHANLIHE